MNSNSNKMYSVGILGGTGVVGQKFIYLLSKHKNFVLKKVAASEKNVNKKFLEATKWKLNENIETNFLDSFILVSPEPQCFTDCDFVFSALTSDVAEEIENEFASSGIPVFSNAKNHRMDLDVPILIPTINAEHIEIIKKQKTFSECGGFIVTNANCSTTGLSVALAPLEKAYGIDAAFVTTMQSISGAGYPGVASLDIIDNIIPFISDEEEKIKVELKKILGNFEDDKIVDADLSVSPSCNRVAVTEGHVLSVSLRLRNRKFLSELDDASFIAEIKNMYKKFSPKKEVLDLPSCPENVIMLFEEKDRPQPRLDRNKGEGMTTCIGRLRRCEIFDLKMTILSHNTVLGAAGGSILNAEFCASKQLFRNRKKD